MIYAVELVILPMSSSLQSRKTLLKLLIMVVVSCGLLTQNGPLFCQESQSNRDAAEFYLIVQKNFALWDLDGSGFLDEKDVDEDIQNPNINGKEAAALSAIKVYFRGNKDQSSTGLSLSQIYPFLSQTGETRFTQIGKALSSLYVKYKNKIAQESPNLYANGIPHIECIKQGKSGDCYFLATIGGLAYRDPQRLMHMIQTCTDGSFYVTFPHHSPIAVPPLTDCELACYSDAGSDGIWLHVLEKAYAIFKNRKKGNAEALDAVIHGGSGGRMIMFVTGNNCTRYPTASTSVEELRQHLQAAMNSNKLVNTGTSGHCLTILAFDPTADLITVWNPWGTDVVYKTVNKKMTHGVFELTFPELMSAFVSLLIEGDRPCTAADYYKMSHPNQK